MTSAGCAATEFCLIKDIITGSTRLHKACRKLEFRPQKGVPALLSRFVCDGKSEVGRKQLVLPPKVQASTNSKPLRNHSIASKPWIRAPRRVERAERARLILL